MRNNKKCENSKTFGEFFIIYVYGSITFGMQLNKLENNSKNAGDLSAIFEF